MGDTLNYLTISIQGTPNGEDGNPFNQQVIIIITADKGIDTRVRQASSTAGYPEIIMNTDVIPSSLVNMGITPGSDFFTFLALIPL